MKRFSLPEMEADEFALWQALLEKKTGLWVPENRKPFLLSVLSSYLKEKEFDCYRDLYTKLGSGEISMFDWASLADALTVNETRFYRDQVSIDLLVNRCKKNAQDGFQQSPDESQHVQVWSVGCSTGEEVYTLAIELDKLSSGLKEAYGKSLYFGITGIDISYPSLALAREGVYSARKLQHLSQVTRNTYFEQLDDQLYKVGSRIRPRTCFIQGNLLDLGARFRQEFDIIFCQNVLIYFRQQRKQEVVQQLAERLKPGGMLILGHGELTDLSCQALTRVESKHCLAYFREHDKTKKVTG